MAAVAGGFPMRELPPFENLGAGQFLIRDRMTEVIAEACMEWAQHRRARGKPYATAIEETFREMHGEAITAARRRRTAPVVELDEVDEPFQEAVRVLDAGEVAARFGCTRRAVTARAADLGGRKIGRDWQFDAAEVERLASEDAMTSGSGIRKLPKPGT